MRKSSLALFGALALSLSPLLGACDLEVQDLNNPSLEELENNPTPSLLNSAATGLIAGHRIGVGAANGYVIQLGILGREAYNFDTADPRYINELLTGSLAKGSPFGGAFWVAPYANIRQANIVIRGADNVMEYPPATRSAIKGFARTFIALDLLRVIITRDTIGAVVDVDKPLGDPLGPIEPKAAVYAAIAKHLDDAKADLVAGGTVKFPFSVTRGFAGFDAADTFLKFNRAIRARVAIYMGDGAGALTALNESFINPMPANQAALDVGPVFVFSANSGDTANAMGATSIWAHPKLSTEAQTNGAVKDARFTRKITVESSPGSGGGLTSNLRLNAYSRTDSTVPIIRNEELILLRAEAELLTGMLPQAIIDLNTVRTLSGGLTALDPTSTADQIRAEIIYNRRYSLLMEGGHRWIDIRRFGISTAPLLDILATHQFNTRYPIPQGECDARPGEAACMLRSVE